MPSIVSTLQHTATVTHQAKSCKLEPASPCPTGLEQGAITHVPSTKDLLAAVPVDRIVDTQAWRQRAHVVGGSLAVGLERLADGRADAPDTPRASFESPGAFTEFAGGALDLEV